MIRLFILLFVILLTACGSPAREDKAAASDAGHDAHSGHAAGDNAKYAQQVNDGTIPEDTLKGSPKRIAMAIIGDVHVHITYGSPGVKKRIIWGGLVPYDQVWVTGAHQATSILLDNPVQIGNKRIEPGTYALFTIPGKEKWEVILNKDYQQHLTDNYDAAKDVVRLTVTPQIQDHLVNRLTYSVSKTGSNTGTIAMEWEKIRIEIPFTSLVTK